MNRRRFFAAVGALAVAAACKREGVITLGAEGITGRLKPGTYIVDGPLHITGPSEIHGCRFLMRGSGMIVLGPGNHRISNCHFGMAT